MAAPHRVVALAFDRVQALDLVGPLEVFSTATRILRARGGDQAARDHPGYELTVVSPGPVQTTSGLEIGSLPLVSADRQIDTLVVAGGSGVRAAADDETLIGWLQEAAGRSRRVASVCTGALLLARAGLLDGRSATTHWASCDLLAERHPAVEVEPDRIFVRDGDVWTSAGVSAGMDLALALVEDDHGHALSVEVARWLVLFAKRPGGQAQFSAALEMQRSELRPLRDVQEWIEHNLERELPVEVLAERAGMSLRGFARAFRREVGLTPAAYVEAVRVERARLALESTTAKVATIARSSGFGTPETMRRAFARRIGVSPAEYRDRFAALSPQQPKTPMEA
jgi:transcriptional regulator GlxA family with amidase domain